MTQTLTDFSAPQQHAKAPKSNDDWEVGLSVLEFMVCDLGINKQPLSRDCIAEAVGCSKQAIEGIENRALQKLRRLTSHFRPELEDMGVVQRLAPKGSLTAVVRSRKVRDPFTVVLAEAILNSAKK